MLEVRILPYILLELIGTHSKVKVPKSKDLHMSLVPGTGVLELKLVSPGADSLNQTDFEGCPNLETRKNMSDVPTKVHIVMS